MKTKLRFSPWAKWKQRAVLSGLQYPGIYALTISRVDIADTDFMWRKEIIYIGMTNSKGGLKSRLNQFENTIIGRDGHGGAHRVRFKHPDYDRLSPRLYVSVWPVECDVNSGDPDDLRAMGDVAKLEYECFALYSEKFNCLPEFNDMKRSPKKVKIIRDIARP